VLFVGAQNTITQPSGWSTLQNVGTASFWTGAVFTKTLTSGDVSAGSVSIVTGGAGGVVAALATFIGATGGIRETDTAYVVSTAPTSFSNSTSSAVVGGDVALMFGCNRGGANPTCDVGTMQQAQADGGNAAAGCLYFDNAPSAGGFTATMGYSEYSPEGFYQAIVIVEA
jgi:hypothetical protein